MRVLCCLLIGLFFLACGVAKNTASPQREFAANNIVAHRGAWKKKKLPENSIASLKEAIRLNCTGSEFDVRMTADDSLIINHDTSYQQRSVERNNYTDLAVFKLSNGEKLPTLREYLLAGMENNPSTRLVCEIKPSTTSKERGKAIAGKVVRLVQALKAKDRVVYISFDYDICKTIVSLDPHASVQYLDGNRTPEQLMADRIGGADYHFSVFKLHPEWIPSARINNIALNAWTVNDTADMDWLLANDFDFITTNEPELLQERIRRSPVTAGWKLVFSDEFNYKGLPDSSKWNYDVGGHGWGNNEKQFYLKNSPENGYVNGGKLHIVALKKQHENLSYTSAKLTTYQRFFLQYGKIEVMAKLPRGKGSWPAIWMLPESIRSKKEPWPLCGEIDIMEHVGKDPGMIHTSLHSELYNHIKGTQVTHFERLPDVFDSFHKYGIEWTKESVKFFIDDKLFLGSFKGQDGRKTTNEGWPYDKPYYLILNLAIGGNWGGDIDDSIFPNDLQVDFVRIFQKKDNTVSNENK